MAKLWLAAMIDRPAAPPVSGTILTERAVEMAFKPWEYRPDAGFAEGTDLTGYTVVAVDGDIGRVEAYYNSNPACLVVVEGLDVASSFGRAVTLPAGLVERIDSTTKKVCVDRTRDQIKDAPSYADKAFADHGDYRKSLGSYYSGTYMPPSDQM